MPTHVHRNNTYVIVDNIDLPAVEHHELRMSGGGLQIKAAGWQRWKPLSVWLTGALCTHKNDDKHDFRRDNLTPSALAWRKYL